MVLSPVLSFQTWLSSFFSYCFSLSCLTSLNFTFGSIQFIECWLIPFPPQRLQVYLNLHLENLKSLFIATHMFFGEPFFHLLQFMSLALQNFIYNVIELLVKHPCPMISFLRVLVISMMLARFKNNNILSLLTLDNLRYSGFCFLSMVYITLRKQYKYHFYSFNNFM